MMAIEHLDQENLFRRRMAEEEQARQRLDKESNKWIKVYFGSGTNFRNWLDQAIELKGNQNMKVEEADPRGFQCYEDSGEKMYRIWVRENDKHEKEREIWS